MNEKTCEECRHFHRHFIKMRGRYEPLYYGHCVYPRLKKRDAQEKACENFEKREEKRKKRATEQE